jgi:hypothetical protein
VIDDEPIGMKLRRGLVMRLKELVQNFFDNDKLNDDVYESRPDDKIPRQVSPEHATVRGEVIGAYSNLKLYWNAEICAQITAQTGKIFDQINFTTSN